MASETPARELEGSDAVRDPVAPELAGVDALMSNPAPTNCASLQEVTNEGRATGHTSFSCWSCACSWPALATQRPGEEMRTPMAGGMGAAGDGPATRTN